MKILEYHQRRNVPRDKKSQGIGEQSNIEKCINTENVFPALSEKNEEVNHEGSSENDINKSREDRNQVKHILSIITFP